MSEESGFQLPTAGPQHELLKPFEGTFKSNVQMWMGPGDPMDSSGVMVNTFQLGGLYLQQEYKGDRTDGPFPSFAGYGYWGYNTTAGVFEGFWIDNASSAMQMETGSVDASGKVWEMKSESEMEPGVKMQKRTIFTVVDDNNHTMDSYMTPPGGEEGRSIFIAYQRA